MNPARSSLLSGRERNRSGPAAPDPFRMEERPGAGAFVELDDKWQKACLFAGSVETSFLVP